jgi:hypothetical protein
MPDRSDNRRHGLYRKRSESEFLNNKGSKRDERLKFVQTGRTRNEAQTPV